MKTLTFLLTLFFVRAFFAQGAGTAIKFDGTDDYIDCGDDASLQITGAITLEAWVKLTETTSWDAMISKAFWDDDLKRYDNTAYELKFSGSTNKVDFWFSKSGDETTDMEVIGNTALTVGQWYHVAAVFSPSSFVKIYVNGVEDASVTSGVVSSIYNSTRPLYLGLGAHTTGGEYLHGYLDEVRIWNIALSADQIRAMMCKKLTSTNLPSGVSWSNLKGYWRLDEGTGTTTNDQTSNDNDGTLKNGAAWVNSGAAIGDASSYDYTGTNPSDFSATISHTNGDYLTATADDGTVKGIQVYRVDGTPMRSGATTPVNISLYTNRYWGVFITGTNPTYSLTYNYNGYPDINDENKLALARRSDNSDDSWSDAAATLNTGDNTLTLSNSTGTEYALAEKTETHGPGKAISFDGTDDYINCGNNRSLDVDDDGKITLEAWVKVSGSTNDEQCIIGRWYDGQTWDASYVLEIENNSLKPRIAINNSSGDLHCTSNEDISANKWHHIAGVYDGTDLKIYADGVLKSTYSNSNGISNSAAPVTIGKYTNSTDPNPFNGVIDEVRIWNTALDITTIRNWMCRTITDDHPQRSHLVGYWKFDNTSGTTCSDWSGKGNDGTMTNMDPSTERVNSGAALGDASAYDYTGTNPGDFSATISHTNGDQLTATGDGGTVQGIQVYRVDATPSRTGAIYPSNISPYTNRYWGVFEIGTSPTYSLTYNYNGYPGISNESKLVLVRRSDNSDDSWSDASATLNTGDNTLTLSNSTGTEYALAEKSGTYGPAKAISFDGTDDYVSLSNALSDMTELTIEAWAYYTGGSNVGVIFMDATDACCNDLVFDMTNSGIGIRADKSGASLEYEGAAAVTGLDLGNAWHHITWTMTSTESKIYVDGILKTTKSVSGSNEGYHTSNPTIGTWWDGNTSNGPKKYFKGILDEVRIWNVALDITTIRNWMCRTITSDHPQRSHLVGYWKFDNTSGTTCSDWSGKGNDGTMTNMNPSTERVNSGAALGDASTYDYSSPTSVTLSHSAGDYVNVSAITGSPDGVQIYRVDGAPNVTTAPGNMTQLFTSRYWGVKIIGGSSPTYTLTYYYNGNPDIGSYENYQDLAKRSDNSATSWTEGNATLNTTAKTLTLTGQTGTEYIDGRENNPTPVELTTFTATVQNGIVMLKWQTATEVNNYGFEVERQNVAQIANNLSNKWETLGFVEGHGNSNSPKEYSFTDKPAENGKYSYRLKQIDLDGSFTYSNTVEAVIGLPTKFELSQNYPNPFSAGGGTSAPITTIKYSIPNIVGTAHELSLHLFVYDMLGRKVATLVNKKQAPGNYSVQFNASNLPSGIYFYRLEAGSFTKVKKMVLLK